MVSWKEDPSWPHSEVADAADLWPRRAVLTTSPFVDFRSNLKIPGNVNVSALWGNLVGVRYPER